MIIGVVLTMLCLYLNAPIIAGEWTKQTIYLWGLNSCHIQTKDAKPRILLIDDDSGSGVFEIKKICDDLQIKATFAVVPSFMSQETKDSLKNWQKQGYGIALHGYNHDDWREWTYDDVLNDIDKSEQWLKQSGFDIHKMTYIVCPRGSNTKVIRKAVSNKGYQMVTGANILNPDTTVFQLGRLMITKDTDLEKMEVVLKKGKSRNMYVILGTHSSDHDEFSTEKTRAVLRMAKNLGYEY